MDAVQVGAQMAAIRPVPFLHTGPQDQATAQVTFGHQAAHGTFKAVEHVSLSPQMDFEALFPALAADLTSLPLYFLYSTHANCLSAFRAGRLRFLV
jgi:hypothetical protein